MACYIFELVFLCLDVPVSCRPNQDTVRSNVVFPQVALNPSESKATEFASSSHPFKYHVCAYLRLIFGLRYLGHHLRPISSRTKEIQVLHTLLLAHASTNQHQYTLGCCHNHLHSIKSPSWSIHPSMNWQSHASSVKLGSWTGNRKQHRQKDDKRNGKSKSFLYIKLLLQCYCTQSSSPASWEQVLLLFSSLRLVQPSSLELPYWDRSPARLVVLTGNILLDSGIWETRKGSSYCPLMFAFVWVDNGQPANWHNTSKAPTCHQKIAKDHQKVQVLLRLFCLLGFFCFFHFLHILCFLRIIHLLHFFSWLCASHGLSRTLRHRSNIKQPSWSGGFPEEVGKNIRPEIMGRLYTRVIAHGALPCSFHVLASTIEQRSRQYID